MTARHRVIAFCLVAGFLYGLGIFWGLPSMLSTASDSPAPLSPLNWIARYRDTSVSFIYPPVHQLICIVAYGAVLAGWKVVGGIGHISSAFPYGFHNPTLVFSSLLLVTNLLSLAMGVGILAFMRTFRLARGAAVWYAMALLGLSGVFTYYARVGNLDVPYVFWCVLSWLFAWHFLFAAPAQRLVVFAAIAGALAIGTKDQAIGLEFGVGLVLLFVSPQGQRWNLRSQIRTAVIFGCVLALAYAVTSIAVNPWRWWAHMTYRVVVPSPEVPNTLWGHLELLRRSTVKTVHILSPGGLLLGLAGLGFLLRPGRRRQAVVLFLPPLAYYASVIMVARWAEERYFLVAAFALALSAGVAAGELLEWTRGRRWLRAALFVLLGGILADQAIEGFVPITYLQLFDVRHAVARDLPALVPPGAPLLAVRMNSFNVPDSRVYERYRLMLPPDKKLFPPSSHGEHALAAYTPDYRYILSGTTLLTETWPATGPLIRRWVYPEWIRRRVYVPAVYEYAFYERPPG
jgi:4-amino-4-deoxy-L-arabinose transferase-like glycosyltransferase